MHQNEPPAAVAATEWCSARGVAPMGHIQSPRYTFSMGPIIPARNPARAGNVHGGGPARRQPGDRRR
jgi:hypothetical protein